MYLVSACLLGLKTRFDGKSKPFPALLEMGEKGNFIPVCPEQLGGLATPRPPAEIQGQGGGDAVINTAADDEKEAEAKVVNINGEDVTEAFVKGARETLVLARLFPVKGVILKQGSPSCGTCYIYDGTFNKKKVKGRGVTAALLKAHGFSLFDEDNLPF